MRLVHHPGEHLLRLVRNRSTEGNGVGDVALTYFKYILFCGFLELLG